MGPVEYNGISTYAEVFAHADASTWQDPVDAELTRWLSMRLACWW
jgi:hypothetical protein